MKKSRNFWESFKFALRGAVMVLQSERNARIDLVFALGVLGAACYYQVSWMEWVILILTIVSVLGAEMMNTAVEYMVDMYTQEYHPLAEKAKNAAAGAVLITAIGAFFVGLIIFGPKVFLH